MEDYSGAKRFHKMTQVRCINKKNTGSEAYIENETHRWPYQKVNIFRELLLPGTKRNWMFPVVTVGIRWIISEISEIASTTVSTVTDASNKRWGYTYDLGQWTLMILCLLFFL